MADRRPRGSRSFAACIAMAGRAGPPEASREVAHRAALRQVSRTRVGASKIERKRNMVLQHYSVDKGPIFYTIGHSTRSVTEFVRLLREAGADFVVDVRSIPRSRTNPQFNADTLPDTLAGERIGYRHVARLGGLRRRHKGQAVSGNGFWENASFRNYADYAATPDFGAGMAELYDIGRDHVCACRYVR